MNGKNETWFFGVRFQFLPEVHDVRIDRARRGIIFVSPNSIKQTISAQRFDGMRDEISKQRELFG